jgi:hypothetical protein
MSMLDAIVIGAGMAGLTAARELTRNGFAVALVEARERTGGRVYSVRDFCGEPVEGGAEFIHTSDAAIWPEIRAAGLAVRRCPLARNSMFNLGGRTRWLPWLLLHPGVWPAFPILRQIRRVGPRDGHDPHDDTPNIPEVRTLKDQFWHPDGAVEDVCSGQPCTAPIPPENAD